MFSKSMFAQLYIYATEHEVQNRLGIADLVGGRVIMPASFMGDLSGSLLLKKYNAHINVKVPSSGRGTFLLGVGAIVSALAPEPLLLSRQKIVLAVAGTMLCLLNDIVLTLPGIVMFTGLILVHA
ncbi:hypothetical protein ACJX0J_009915 [Zea mays]